VRSATARFGAGVVSVIRLRCAEGVHLHIDVVTFPRIHSQSRSGKALTVR